MPFATAKDGTNIHYDVTDAVQVGERPVGERQVGERQVGERQVRTVVLVQGLGLSGHFWFDLPERLAKDEPGSRVITLDNRGTGRSDKPRGPYSMARMADDIAAVLDASGTEKATIVGISLGGMITQHVALRHPSRVEGLVLMATTPGFPHARLAGPRTLAALVSLSFARGNVPARALPRLLIPPKHLHRARELMAKWPAAMRQNPVTSAGFFAQLAAAVTHSTGFSLKNIRCPVVVVTGADDILIPRGNSELIARRIPGAVLEVLPDVGHAIPMLDEMVVSRALARLRSLSADALSADANGPPEAAT
jgi:3-oxoadipate enol-lactonase